MDVRYSLTHMTYSNSSNQLDFKNVVNKRNDVDNRLKNKFVQFISI